MIHRAAARASALLFALAALPGCAQRVSGDPKFAAGPGIIGDYSVPVSSLLARKFNTVVRQQYDFSCGSAALATLLRYHYGLDRGETDVFTGMWREGNQAQIRKVGFSLLDMKRYLSQDGLSADGFKVSLEAIEKRRLPGVALITVKGYRHFVVLKGITPTDVLIGDPSLGLRTMPRATFQQAWNGVYFVLNSRPDVGQRSFNGAIQWAALPRSPISGLFVDPLSQQALMLTAPFIRDF